MFKSISQVRVSERVAEQIVSVPFRYVMEEKVQCARLIPQERIQQRIVEIVAILVPQIQEHVVEVFNVIPQERVSECVVEQIVAVPQIQEHVVEVFKVIPQERVSERMGEKTSWRWGKSFFRSAGVWTSVDD